jgi:DNA-binding phage protein
MSKRRRPRVITNSLKAVIRKSGLTHYRIAKDAGFKPEQLDRFMSGDRDIMLATADRIAKFFGLELRERGE